VDTHGSGFELAPSFAAHNRRQHCRGFTQLVYCGRRDEIAAELTAYQILSLKIATLHFTKEHYDGMTA
jgi:hypothetical protein